MDARTKATATKPATFDPPMNEASRAYREMGEKGTAQAKEMYEKMTAATSEATDVIKESFSTAVNAVNGAQDYNNKLLEFAQSNTNTAFEFAKRLLDVKSPSEFIELSTERTRKQFETLTEQTTELAALAQRVTLASTEPLKAGVTKAFGQSS